MVDTRVYGSSVDARHQQDGLESKKKTFWNLKKTIQRKYHVGMKMYFIFQMHKIW